MAWNIDTEFKEENRYPITMGDKDTQMDDINRCHQVARTIRARVSCEKKGGK